MKKLGLFAAVLMVVAAPVWAGESITGTANQIYVADNGDGSVTLSTPQDIDANATPEFADLFEDQPFSYIGKKIEIISPYVTKSNEYRGQLHCHSTNSDGVDTPTALVTAYKNAGYDFVAITDHNFLNSDPGVSGILFLKGVEETASGGDIVSIEPSSQKTQTASQDIIDAIIGDNAFPCMAHPNFLANPWTNEELESIDDYMSIEVYNDKSAPNNEDKWDTLLTKNRRSFGTAVDDCHSVASSNFNKGWIEVFADALTVSEVMDALKRGNFYSSTGPTLWISVSKKVITATTDSLSTIDWIGSGGATLQSDMDVASASYTVIGNERYVRVKINRNSDSKNAWSNPIYIYQLPTSELKKGGLVRGNVYISGQLDAHLSTGSARMRVKSDNDAAIGIFDRGNVKNPAYIRFNTLGVDPNSWFIGMPGGEPSFAIRYYNSGWKPYFTIKTDGKVGFGTTNPTRSLDISFTTGDAGMRVKSGNAGASGAFDRGNVNNPAYICFRTLGADPGSWGFGMFSGQAYFAINRYNNGWQECFAIGTNGDVSMHGLVIDNGGFLKPISAADASAPNNSIYYSTTQRKLVYKDSSGTANPLY